MIKTNIKIRVTPEQSRRVQEICFSKNIMWGESRDKVMLTERPFLYIFQDYISSCDSESHFKISTPKEIDADLFIKTNGSCEETYIYKYGGTLPKDYNSALKKIENLHIALNKKVEKNKNQKEQITLLLKQKKGNKEFIKSQDEMANYFMLQNAEKELIIKELTEQLKEKETIISYLEGKLK